MCTGLTPAWKIPCKHSIQSRYLYKIQLRFVYSIFREKFTGNQTTSHLLAYSSIIICLNGVFIKCVLCYSRKFLLRFVVFLIFVHYLTFGRGLHLKKHSTNSQQPHKLFKWLRTHWTKKTNKLLNSIFRIMRTTNVPPLKAFSIYEFR